MFHIYYPPLVCVALFLALVIVLLLRHGSKFLKLRHTGLEPKADWYDKGYRHPTDSYA